MPLSKMISCRPSSSQALPPYVKQDCMAAMLHVVFVSIVFECQQECTISLLKSVALLFSLSQFPSKNLRIMTYKTMIQARVS